MPGGKERVMTREEAKQFLIEHCNPMYPDRDKTQWDEAINMAIEALGETNIGDTISRKAAIKALDDISRAYYELGLSCAYDMPSFWYNEKKDYKVIPTKYHKGYQQALEDSEQRIKKIMEELCYG